MLLRPRAAASAAGPADRVRILLAPGGSGWVPPPQPGDAAPEPAGQAGATASHGRGGPRDSPTDAAPGSGAAGVPADGAPVGGDRKAADTDTLPAQRSWATTGPARDEGTVRTHGRPSPDRPAARVGAHAARGTGLPLPAGLAGGRLTPSRRAAAALVAVALLAAVVAGAVVLRGRPQEVVASTVLSSGVPLPGVSTTPHAGGGAAGAAGAPSAGTHVVVAVAGKVRRPGLVRLPPGSRVDDAVRAAGGTLPDASPGLLNLARRLVDGEQVLVGVDPPPGQRPADAPGAGAGGPGSGPATGSGLLDLNAATAADLDQLPGIGPVLAQRIVDWRTEHGRFASVEQLREVTGIGERKYEDLQERVTV